MDFGHRGERARRLLLAWAGSDGSLQVYGLPLFSISVAFAFLIQWMCFVPSFLFQTEKYFDLTGSLTYVSILIFALIMSDDLGLRKLAIGLLFYCGHFDWVCFYFLESDQLEKIRDLKL